MIRKETSNGSQGEKGLKIQNATERRKKI